MDVKVDSLLGSNPCIFIPNQSVQVNIRNLGDIKVRLREYKYHSVRAFPKVGYYIIFPNTLEGQADAQHCYRSCCNSHFHGRRMQMKHYSSGLSLHDEVKREELSSSGSYTVVGSEPQWMSPLFRDKQNSERRAGVRISQPVLHVSGLNSTPFGKQDAIPTHGQTNSTCEPDVSGTHFMESEGRPTKRRRLIPCVQKVNVAGRASLHEFQIDGLSDPQQAEPVSPQLSGHFIDERGHLERSPDIPMSISNSPHKAIVATKTPANTNDKHSKLTSSPSLDRSPTDKQEVTNVEFGISHAPPAMPCRDTVIFEQPVNNVRSMLDTHVEVPESLKLGCSDRQNGEAVQKAPESSKRLSVGAGFFASDTDSELSSVPEDDEDTLNETSAEEIFPVGRQWLLQEKAPPTAVAQRPARTWVQLITEALSEAPSNCLTAQDICTSIVSKYDYYATFSRISIQSSVAATLSQRPNFEKKQLLHGTKMIWGFAAEGGFAGSHNIQELELDDNPDQGCLTSDMLSESSAVASLERCNNNLLPCAHLEHNRNQPTKRPHSDCNHYETRRPDRDYAEQPRINLEPRRHKLYISLSKYSSRSKSGKTDTASIRPSSANVGAVESCRSNHERFETPQSPHVDDTYQEQQADPVEPIPARSSRKHQQVSNKNQALMPINDKPQVSSGCTGFMGSGQTPVLAELEAAFSPVPVEQVWKTYSTLRDLLVEHPSHRYSLRRPDPAATHLKQNKKATFGSIVSSSHGKQLVKQYPAPEWGELLGGASYGSSMMVLGLYNGKLVCRNDNADSDNESLHPKTIVPINMGSDDEKEMSFLFKNNT